MASESQSPSGDRRDMKLDSSAVGCTPRAVWDRAWEAIPEPDFFEDRTKEGWIGKAFQSSSLFG
jgi:hypothetical protein